ncbi:MAG TPA: sodium:solute symporter family protein [Gammaproteobacteria bacterium]|jgi:SSS family solute:Na+ symporter|nr:sodium:solute symporter family protein [Gammaproteobacteria bacterium]
MPIELIPCIAYLGLAFLLGMLPGLFVTRSVSGYVAGDRSLSTLLLYFVLGAAVFSSFAFLGGPGWAYSRGAAAFYILIYGMFGMIPFYFLGPRARRIGSRLGFYTQAEIVGHRFDNRSLQVTVAVLSLVAMIPYLALQIKGVGYILNVASHGLLPEWEGALLAYGVVTLYVLYSGMLGVSWTSVFMGIAMMVIGWLFGLYLPWKFFGGVEAMFHAIAVSPHAAMLVAPGLNGEGAHWDWWGYSSAIVVSVLGFCCWPHFFMRSMAAKDDRSIKLMVVMYPTMQIFMVPVLIIGFSAVLLFVGVRPVDTILPFMLQHAGLSPWLVGLASAGTLAASMHTGDALMHAAGTVGVRDILVPLWPRALSDRDERRLIRLLVLLVTAAAYYIAVVSHTSLVELLLGSYGGVAQIFPTLIATFYWRRATAAGTLAGLAVGIAVNLLFMFEPTWRPLPLHEGIYGLAANVLVLIGVSLLTKPVSAERLKAYSEPGWD